MLKLLRCIRKVFFFKEKERGIALKQGNILIQFKGCCFLFRDYTVLKTV